MTNYIIRRLFLMVPTLIGITFMVFMLIALSPGGIGASLRMSGSGQMDQSSAAEQQAYLEDRYGLDDPVLVQYGRWLARIFPLKFGVRDQVAPDGEIIRMPKVVKEPPLWDWFADELPVVEEPAPFAWPVGEWGALSEADIASAKSSIYAQYRNGYARARARYLGSRSRFERAAGNYAQAADLSRAMTATGKLRESVFRNAKRDRNLPEWAEFEARANDMLDAYKNASGERAAIVEVFKAQPFPQMGIGTRRVWLAKPDFGKSFSTSRPVLDDIGDALPVTLMINAIAIPLIYLVAIPSGIVAALKRGSLLDIGSGALFIALLSIPTVLAGVLAIGFLADKQYVGAFPVSRLHAPGSEEFPFLPSRIDGVWHRGYVVDTLWHMCLPVLCLVYTGFAILSKQTRAAMLDNFSADYVRTAKAKGVAPRDVVFAHVFRNSLLPLITIFVTIFPAMLSGSVVIEQIFTVPGMGKLVIEAINDRDRELLLATTLMIGTVNLLALLLADILYALADPRISYK